MFNTYISETINTFILHIFFCLNYERKFYIPLQVSTIEFVIAYVKNQIMELKTKKKINRTRFY